MTTDEELRDELRAFILRVSDPTTRKKALRAFHFGLVHVIGPERISVGQDALADSAQHLEALEGSRVEAAAVMADSFVKAARTLAERHPRRQAFDLCAYTSSTPGAPPVTTLPFNVDPTHQRDDVLGLEDPTPVGVAGTLQRLADTFIKQNVELVRVGREDSQRTANLFRTQAEAMGHLAMALLGQLVTSTAQTQAALDAQQLRNTEAARATLEIQERQQIVSVLKHVVMVYMDNKLGVGPISQLLRGVPREQLELLHNALPEPQRAPFREVLGSHLGIHMPAPPIAVQAAHVNGVAAQPIPGWPPPPANGAPAPGGAPA